MKKIIFFLAFFLVFLWINNTVNASCSTQPTQKFSFDMETSWVVNIRTSPCIIEGNIYRTAAVWEKYEVIWESDIFYQVKWWGNKTLWIWKNASKKLAKTPLSSRSKKTVEKFISDVYKLQGKYGEDFPSTIKNRIFEILSTKRLSTKNKAIFREIYDQLDKKIQEEKDNIEPVIPEEETDNTEKEPEKEVEKEPEVEKPTIPEVDISGKLSKYNVDFEEVKDYWMGLNNDARSSRGIYKYKYSKTLEQTAFDWSAIQKSREEASHKRDVGDSFYNYKKITSWLWDRGVTCKNISGKTHTENVGWGMYTCTDGNCTDELKQGVKRTFDFFMKEEFQDYQAHYQSIVNQYFTELWFGVDIKETGKNQYEFYLTVHYCTELE